MIYCFRVLIAATTFSVAFLGPAHSQDFSSDPQGAIERSVSLAQEAMSDPLVFEGLKSFVVRYNRARAEIRPAGYENLEWLQGQVFAVTNDVNAKFPFIGEVSPLPAEEISDMLDAFNENADSYYTFYASIQEPFGFADISPDQMLHYLSAYAVAANSVDPSLWDALSSFTGVWPLCFWQG